MKNIIYAGLAILALGAQAEIPEGYYDQLSGKKGDELREAVKAAAHPSNFKHVSYGDDSWEAFKNTDTRIVDGITVWWDMYSNRLVPVTGRDGLNIEHSVPNSWFGQKAGCPEAYADLFHLHPSNEAANNQKGNLPLGEVATIAWENGLVKTGAPKTNSAGTANKVFEPTDEYKGDFARAYFYIFTAYDNAPWIADQPMYTFSSSATLEPWAVDMLRRWAKEDPVDSKEIKRNEEIYKFQKNRNPFIDYPELIEYLWGDLSNEIFTPTEGAVAIDRPEEPQFASRWITGVNTYSGRWWDKETVGINYTEGDALWVSINGEDYQQFGPGVDIPAGSTHGNTLTLTAYTEREIGEYTLRSSLARLTLTAKDPTAEDYTESMWRPVVSNEDFTSTADQYFILRSVSNGNIMGHLGGTKSSSFMPDAGRVKEEGDMIYRIPVDAAILHFRESSAGKYVIEVIDPLHHKSKGFWNVTSSGNKNTLDATTGTAATISINDGGEAVITFDGGKTLQYNRTQPRFTNYASKQGGVALAHYSDESYVQSGMDEETIGDEGFIAIDGNNIILPEGWMLYSLNGRSCNGLALDRGIYIARSPKGKAVKILIP